LRAVAEGRGLGWVALSDDVEFAQRSGGERHRLVAETGEVGVEPLWRRLSAGLRRRRL
jgi:hypothetical protein